MKRSGASATSWVTLDMLTTSALCLSFLLCEVEMSRVQHHSVVETE